MIEISKQLSVATLYLLFGFAIHRFIPDANLIGILWPGSGLALAALLIGGKRYIWAVLLGSLLLYIATFDSIWVIAGLSIANVMEALFGYWLLTKKIQFSASFQTLSDFLNLVLVGAIVSLTGAVLGALALLLANIIIPAEFFNLVIHRWMGHTIGIVLLTTLILSWLSRDLMNELRRLESVFLIGLAVLVGQIVFLDWFHDSIGLIAGGYWMFLFVTWVAIRIGVRGVTLVLMSTAIQALAGAIIGTGFFSTDIAKTGLHNYWYYMLILSLVGMAMATYVIEIQRGMAALQLKDVALNATANGIVITDIEGRIEWANQSFSRLTGYSLEDVLGLNPKHLLKSGKQEDAYYKAMWDTILANKVWRGELTNRRKDGSLYDEDMTITPITDAQGEISHFVAVKQDVTERTLAENKRRESEARFRFMLESSPIAVRVTNLETGKVKFANQRYAELISLDRQDVIGINPKDYYTNPQDYAEIIEQLSNGERVTDKLLELLITGEHSATKWVLASYLKLDFEDQPAILGWFYDISKMKSAESKLRVSDMALKAVSQGVIITDKNESIISVNKAFTTITGYSQSEIMDHDPRFLQGTLTDPETVKAMHQAVASEIEFSGTVQNYRKNGAAFWNELTISPLFDDQGQLTHFIGVTRDITERVKMEEEVRQLAFFDVLTKLPNRRLLDDRLSQTIGGSRRNGHFAALMVMDMDNFKSLNDTHGHIAGDLLLAEVARRLSACVRETDTAARFGGDEFVVLLSHLGMDRTEATMQAEIVAQKIRASLADTYILNLSTEQGDNTLVEHHCTASIGVTLFGDHTTSREELFSCADEAMYQAKEAGRNQVRFHQAKHE